MTIDKLDEKFLWDIASEVGKLLLNQANRKVFEQYADEFHKEWTLYKEAMMQWGEKAMECREKASKDEKWRNEETEPPETDYKWDYYHCCWLPPSPILPTLRLKVGHGGIIPRDATENLKRSYLWLIIIHDAELQTCVSPIDKNSEPLAGHIGIFEGNLTVRNEHVLYGSETYSGRHLIETALMEVKSDLANAKPTETERKDTPTTIININKLGVLGDVQKVETLQTGDNASTHKHIGSEEKKKGILSRIPYWIYLLVSFLAAIFACIHYWPEIQQKFQSLFYH